MILGATLLTDRKSRRVLDRARNPKSVTAHAVARFVQDTLAIDRKAVGLQLGDAPIEFRAPEPDEARADIRALCQKAKRIFRGRNCFILHARPWFIFYRDDTVVSVMHEQSTRKL